MKGIQLRNKANNAAEILIYEDIGDGFWTSGVTASGFLKDLKDLGPIDTLDIRINSNGGSVFDGIAIYNALKRHPATKNVYVDGIAASIASIIAMAGDSITMGEGTFLMIHNASGLSMGNASDMRAMADVLDGIDAQLVDIYANRTGMDAEVLAQMMADETWMNADDAIAGKFADHMGEPMRIAAHANADRFHNIPDALKQANRIDAIVAAVESRIAASIAQGSALTHSQPHGPTEQQENHGASTAPASPIVTKGQPMNAKHQLQARAAEHQAAAAGIREKANAEERALSSIEMETMNSHLDAFEQARAELELLDRTESANEWLNSSAGRKVQPTGLQNTNLQTAQEKGRWGFNNLGEFAKTVRNAVIGNGVDTRLVKNATLSTYGSEDTGADGGYAVPPDFRTEIQSLVMGEGSMLAQCDSMPTAGKSVTFPTDETTAWQTSGGVLTYWGAEAGAMSQSKPSLKEVSVNLHKLYAFVPVTDEMLEDVPMMGRYLTGKAGDKLNFAVTDAIVNGTGVGKPLGIMTAPCKIEVAKESSQAAATIVGSNILKMYARQLNPGRSVWLVNADTLAMILSLNIEFKSSAGAGIAAGARFPTITFPGENGSTFATIMGRPVIVTEACQTLGTAGDIIFADLSGGYFAPYKAGGVRNDISMHLWFDQGVTAFRWTMRVGGQPWLSAAVSSKNSSASRSSVVALATRA